MFIDKDALERLITPEMRASLFRDLGVEVDSFNMGRRGWVRHLFMPERIRQDTKPSFSVNLKNGGVNDFGSDYSSDFYGFVQDCIGCNYPDALRWTIKKVGEQVARDIETIIYNQKDQRLMKDAYSIEEVKIFCDELVNEGSEGAASLKRYLVNRGLQVEMIGAARLGYVEDMGESWLFIPYDIDEENETVPYYKMIAFDPKKRGTSEGDPVGGWVRADDGGKKVRTSGAARLYPERLLQKKNVMLCEGELDALIARQCGANAITTTAGASTFNRQFAETIQRAGDTVFIAYDGDEAGREGREKAGRVLVKAGLKVRFCDLPEGQDVNDVYLDGGADAVRALVQESTLFEWEPEPETEGIDMEIEKIFGFLDVQWASLSDDQRNEAVRGMQRILSREGLGVQRIADPEPRR